LDLHGGDAGEREIDGIVMTFIELLACIGSGIVGGSLGACVWADGFFRRQVVAPDGSYAWPGKNFKCPACNYERSVHSCVDAYICECAESYAPHFHYKCIMCQHPSIFRSALEKK
jgi:hypothetical protein